MILFEPQQLMRFEHEERRFQPRKQCRYEDQNGNDEEEDDQSRNRHSFARLPACNRLSSVEPAGLLIMRAGTTLKLFMDKGERISRFVSQMVGTNADPATGPVVDHPFYRAYFQCWNEQQYYEAHDVLEQVWLNKDSADDNFFKGLIQAAGAFVHLKKNFEHPHHPKHGKRLRPAVRLFQLAETNLIGFAPRHHGLDVVRLLEILKSHREAVIQSEFQINPWSPATAPRLTLNEIGSGA
jgi:uncharacterized protein